MTFSRQQALLSCRVVSATATSQTRHFPESQLLTSSSMAEYSLSPPSGAVNDYLEFFLSAWPCRFTVNHRWSAGNGNFCLQTEIYWLSLAPPNPTPPHRCAEFSDAESVGDAECFGNHGHIRNRKNTAPYLWFRCCNSRRLSLATAWWHHRAACSRPSNYVRADVVPKIERS